MFCSQSDIKFNKKFNKKITGPFFNLLMDTFS